MNGFAKSPVLALAAVLATLAIPLQADPLVKSPAPAQQALVSLTDGSNSPLPPGTRLKEVTIREGLATANFSRQLKDNFPGGDTAEMNTVNAILRTLGQFPTVDKVQILVEGQRIDSLGGLISIADPLPVIRPSAAAKDQARYLHRHGHAVR